MVKPHFMGQIYVLIAGNGLHGVRGKMGRVVLLRTTGNRSVDESAQMGLYFIS
jgi:hypothetical protein